MVEVYFIIYRKVALKSKFLKIRMSTFLSDNIPLP